MVSQKTFPDRLKMSIEASNLTQNEIASIIGVSQAAISQWLNDERKPASGTIRDLAQALDVSESWLEDGSGQTPKNVLKLLQMESGWGFRPEPSDGGRDYGNANIWTIPWRLENLVRESIQNSIDAKKNTDKDEIIETSFQVIKLQGEDLDHFLSAINWHSTENGNGLEDHIIASRSSENKLGAGLNLEYERFKKEGHLLLLRIDDHNTQGLVGPERGTGNFAALTRNNLDSSQKSRTAGGAYGLGKAVFWRASRFSTVFFNSIPMNTIGDPKSTRLIGKSDLPWHKIGRKRFAGPGWFGNAADKGDEIESFESNPSLAYELYLDREPGDSGASILVVGFHDPSADEELDIQDISEQIQKASADHFWPALATGRLKTTVSTWIGREMQSKIRVDPEKFNASFVDAIRKFASGKLSDHLLNEGDVVLRRIILDVPRREVAPTHPATEHEAVLLVRRESEHGADTPDETVFFRSQGMIVMRKRYRLLGSGAHPYRAILMAGIAAGNGDSDRQTEEFLRASEPPAHNEWVLTPEVKEMYAWGAGKALVDFENKVKDKIRETIRPTYEDLEEGPPMLRELLKLTGFDPPPPPRPSIQIDQRKSKPQADGGWLVEGVIWLPNKQKWRIMPALYFAAESGRGTKVEMRLEALSGCSVKGDYLSIPNTTQEAKFRGWTDPELHPVNSKDAAVEVILQNVISE